MNQAAQFLNDERPAFIVNDEPVASAECYTEDLREDLCRLLKDHPLFSGLQNNPAPWVQDLCMPNGTPAEGWHAIVNSNNGKLYRVDFSIGPDGEPQLSASDPIEVERDTTYEPVAGGSIEPDETHYELGRDAAYQKYVLGKNPPGWAVNEDKWENAKTAASKSYDEGDDAYWPVVVSIYENMHGTIKGKKAS